jgi:hypothetical protein
MEELRLRGSYTQTMLLPITSLIIVHIGVIALWQGGFWYISEFEVDLSWASVIAAVFSIFLVAGYLFTSCRGKLKVTGVQELPRLCAAFILCYTLVKGNPSVELLVLAICLSVPYFALVTIGWPDFLQEERERELKALQVTTTQKSKSPMHQKQQKTQNLQRNSPVQPKHKVN